MKTDVEDEQIKSGLLGTEQEKEAAICDAYERYKRPLAAFIREKVAATLDSDEIATAINDVFCGLAKYVICDDNLEKEADHFASVLLLPTFALRVKLGARGFLTLQHILDLASEWKTSATSAVLRYIKFATEPCAALVSRGGKILYYVPSEEAGEMGFKYLGRREVPSGTPSMKAGASVGNKKIVEGSTSTNTWFSARRADATVWEEAFPLGYTNLVITLFAFENDTNGQMGFKRFS